MLFKANPYQQAVFDFIEHGAGNAAVEAVAGSGKTTTLVQALELIPAIERVCFLAFNVNITNELKKRVNRPFTDISTFHSLAMRALLTVHPHLEVRTRKLAEIANNLRDQWSAELWDDSIDDSKRLVALAKNNNLVAPTKIELVTLAEHHGINASDEVLILTQQLFQLSVELMRGPKGLIIDFDDMLYHAVNLPYVTWPHYDYTFVDEAQDLNPLRVAVLHCLQRTNPNIRVIAVGDPRQAIYGFAGSDDAALPHLKQQFNMVTLPLSVSYRCPRAVVQYAKDADPTLAIEAYDGAAEGLVTSPSAPYELTALTPTDVIICRNIAPMVRVAYRLLRAKVRARIEGRDSIGAALKGLVKRQRVKTIDALNSSLVVWYARQMNYCDSVDKPDLADRYTDQYETLTELIGQLPETDRTIKRLLADIAELFSDVNGCVTLTTIHKAKGREWSRVHLLDEWRIPSRFATKEWQKTQEENLRYVAITRAKAELVLIDTATCMVNGKPLTTKK